MNKNTDATRKVLPKEFVDNMGRLKKPENQPSPESKSKGWDVKRGRKDLANMIFEQMMKDGTVKEAVKIAKKKTKDGESKEAIELLKLVTPKDIDLGGAGLTLNITFDKQDEGI